MPKTVRFKNTDTKINFYGHTVHSGNITLEMYDALVAAAPSHADLFIVEEEAEAPVKKSRPGKDGE